MFKKVFSFLVILFTVLCSNAQMILEFNTNLGDGTTITLPLYGTVDVTVDWGDSTIDMYNTKGLKNHTYSAEGIYLVTINGSLTVFGVSSNSNATKLTEVKSFGDLGLISLEGAFENASNLKLVPSSIPKTVTNISGMFYKATSFNDDISDWDVSNITTMRSLFFEANIFNQEISNWNVSNVKDMAHMFRNATTFNQNIGNWDVSNVTNMSNMFLNATSFNQYIGNWDVSSVNNMSGMFFVASSFNSDISKWDVSKVTDMSYMFDNATSFNQNIGSWNVKNVRNMGSMFSSASSFNQAIGNWDISKVTNIGGIFARAISFNQDISNWDISNVTDMNSIFYLVKLSTCFYNNILIKWSSLNVKNNMELYAPTCKYSADAATARQYLIDNFGWTITDGGLSNLPTIQTDTITEIGFTSALSGGIITSDAGSTITTKGIVWNTSKNPTLATNLGNTTEGSGTETYSSNLSGLTAGETYYVRAYAANGNGTEYGNQLQFIPQQEINLTGSFSANSKVYDGKQNAELTSNNLTINNLVTGYEDVSLSSINLVFNDKNVGQNKIISINDVQLLGSDSLKYNVNYNTAPTTTANISCKSITTSDVIVEDKIYDGTSNAIISTLNLEGVISGDSVFVLDTIASFANKNVGTFKTITTTITLSGADSINYNLTQPIGLTADITKNEIAITSETVDNKVYDGTILTTILGATIEGVISGDDLAIADSTATFDNKNVGNSKTVTSNITLTGVDTINYTLTQPTGLAANISKKELTVTSASADTKIYDGTTITTISGAIIEGVVFGDDLTIADSSATFDNKNVGTSKIVTSNLTLSGPDTINYYLTQPTGLTAEITKKELSVINASANNKVYDGTIRTTISGTTLDGVILGDDLVIADSTATFENKNVGTFKTIAINITLSGTDTINYSLVQPTGLNADITKKELTVTNAIADNKIYDGKTTTTISGATIEGIVSGDDLAIADTSAIFDSKNVGTSKTVTSNITLTGADSINYTLTQPIGLTANITKKELTIINASADSKVYDGTTNTIISGVTIEGVVSGDDIVIADSSATFDNKNVGTSKSVSSNIILSGADTINYTFTRPTNLTADITKKELTITDAIANNKIYDGITLIEISNASLSGLISGDDVAIKDTTGTVDDKNVGEAKEVNSTITLSGTDTINYYLTQPTGLTVNITPKTITLSGSFTVEDKDYDETTSATIKDSNLVLDGVISPDIVTLSKLVLDFSQAEIGNDITVTITEAEILGDDAGNYELSLDGAPTTTANIIEPVGIDKNNNIELSVYPNPFDNQLNIDAQNEISSITITTITGKVITYKGGTGLNNISVGQLPQGIYLVNVLLVNNQSKTFKMIKK